MYLAFQGSEQIELATHIQQFFFVGIEGFTFPICYYPTANLDGCTLTDLYWKCVSALAEWDFQAHMAVCDGGQCNRSFVLLHFEDEEDAIKKKFTIFSERTGLLHVFMMDPSVS